MHCCRIAASKKLLITQSSHVVLYAGLGKQSWQDVCNQRSVFLWLACHPNGWCMVLVQGFISIVSLCVFTVLWLHYFGKPSCRTDWLLRFLLNDQFYTGITFCLEAFHSALQGRLFSRDRTLSNTWCSTMARQHRLCTLRRHPRVCARALCSSMNI